MNTHHPIDPLARALAGTHESKLPPHLRDDASYLRCSECGRKSWGGSAINSPCALPQPDGAKCAGIMEGMKP